MKNTIKALVNQVKKALTTKSSLPEMISNSAYVDGDGAIIAHDFNKHNEPDHDIIIFVAGIVEDVAKREKLYNKDALTLAGDTGIFNGGKELPEAYANLYKVPSDAFKYVTTIPADDLKAAAAVVSQDRTRPVLTTIHIDVKGLYIEAVDGFRAYRKKLAKALDVEALTPFERDNGLLIPGRAAAYNFKNDITVYNSEKYLKLIDDTGLTLYIKKTYQGAQYINLASIYDGRGSYKREANEIKARIIDVKGFTSVLKTATGAKDAHGKTTIVIRTRKGFIDYYIPAADIFGSIEADTEATPNGFNAIFNARYLYDAIANQECYTLEISKENNAPMYIANNDACALVLPIRGGNEKDYFVDYKPEAVSQETAEAADDPEKEAEAIARINERQNKENHFTNISREDVKQEIEKQEAEAPADDPETIPPEVQEARTIYKRLIACKFTPSKVQEAEADAIYTAYRDRLAPIARKAGGLYIDTLSIIAATMAVYDDLMEA